MIPDSTVTPRNLITEYGRLTIENIGVTMQNFIGQHKRQADNSFQFFHCLANSVIEAAHLNIMDDDTTVGELLFKLMIKNAIISTIVTANYLR